MRLNKYISHNTNYSRREADKLIEEGRIKIKNFVVKDFSREIGEDDKVYLDGKPIKEKEEHVYTILVYNKQKGELTTKKDPMERKTIYHTLSSQYKHFIPVGRLDFASEGLLILTDAPKIADFLQNSDLSREYKIKLDGPVTKEMEEAMEKGIELSDATKGAHRLTNIKSMKIKPFEKFEVQKNGKTYSRLKVTINEGQNRELRRFFGHFNREVLDLKRVSFGEIELNNLPSGKSRFLSRKEYTYVRNLMKDAQKLEGKKGKGKEAKED